MHGNIEGRQSADTNFAMAFDRALAQAAGRNAEREAFWEDAYREFLATYPDLKPASVPATENEEVAFMDFVARRLASRSDTTDITNAHTPNAQRHPLPSDTSVNAEGNEISNYRTKRDQAYQMRQGLPVVPNVKNKMAQGGYTVPPEFMQADLERESRRTLADFINYINALRETASQKNNLLDLADVTHLQKLLETDGMGIGNTPEEKYTNALAVIDRMNRSDEYKQAARLYLETLKQ